MVDITTTGRHPGEPRRIEIWLRPLADHYVIAGLPGTRDWFASQKMPEGPTHYFYNAR